jgi:hypothetical protein
MLQYYLKIPNKSFFHQEFVASLIYPYIENKNNKKRLIEKPEKDLKSIQSRLKRILSKFDYPEYVFSGIKGRSYPDNAKLHTGNKFLYKIDLTAFFPSIAREKVFEFFREKLCTSPDVAEILTNFTTVDLNKASVENPVIIDSFLKEKGLKTKNHLISGSPTSQLLSYLVNQDMFDKLHNLSMKNSVIMSIYVDDMIFSSKNHISARFRLMVSQTITSYHYKLSSKKTKAYTRFYPKRVTGTIINRHGAITIPNSLREKIVQKCAVLKNNPENEQCRRELRGLVEAARQIIPNAYPSIYSLAYDSRYKL